MRRWNDMVEKNLTFMTVIFIRLYIVSSLYMN